MGRLSYSILTPAGIAAQLRKLEASHRVSRERKIVVFPPILGVDERSALESQMQRILKDIAKQGTAPDIW